MKTNQRQRISNPEKPSFPPSLSFSEIPNSTSSFSLEWTPQTTMTITKPPIMSPSPLNRKPNPLADLIFSAFPFFLLFSSPKPSPIFLPDSHLNPRRFHKIPAMSLNNNRHNFPTPQSLSDWLRPRLPSDSFAAWGTKPGTKNIHNLWLELSEGETSLADSNPPVRTVEVVIVRVRDSQGRLLIESHQELSNGDVRNRSRPLSEKMKPGESVEFAVVRAVKEELGSIIGGSCSWKDFDYSGVVKIVPNTYTNKVEERLSLSYPGLPACYVLHSVDAMVNGLPAGEFCTVEEEEYGDSEERKVADGAVSCKKHYWKWVDSDSV